MVRLNLHMHYSLTAIALLTLTASHIAAAMSYYEIEQYEERIQSMEKARGNAPEVVDILVRSVEQQRRNGKVWYAAEVEIFNVIRTHRGIEKGDVIHIEYMDISASARQHNHNIEHNLIIGPGFKSELYMLKEKDEVRAYLRSASGNSRVLTLAVGTGSFSFDGISTESAIDPCSDHSKEQFTSQLKKCGALNLQSAILRLEITIEGIDEFLQGSSEMHEETDTIGKQQRALAASSVAWEDYRDNTCQLVYLQYFGGSFAGIHELDCMTLLTEDRIKQLERIYSGWVVE